MGRVRIAVNVGPESYSAWEDVRLLSSNNFSTSAALAPEVCAPLNAVLVVPWFKVLGEIRRFWE